MRSWNKSMLTLGAAVAVSGLVAAAPAQAAMTGAPCGAKTTKCGGAMGKNDTNHNATAKCGGKCSGKAAKNGNGKM